MILLGRPIYSIYGFSGLLIKTEMEIPDAGRKGLGMSDCGE